MTQFYLLEVQTIIYLPLFACIWRTNTEIVRAVIHNQLASNVSQEWVQNPFLTFSSDTVLNFCLDV